MMRVSHMTLGSDSSEKACKSDFTCKPINMKLVDFTEQGL